MTKNAITILDQLIQGRSTNKQKRLTELLKNHAVEHAEGWYMCVPPCFNGALDIKLTERSKDKKKGLEWTQGSSFSFNRGDTLYDTSAAYNVWSEALKSIGLCVQVNAASNAADNSKENNGPSAGSVTFSMLIPNSDRTKLVHIGEHTLTQDDFVRFLIMGLTADMKDILKKRHMEMQE